MRIAILCLFMVLGGCRLAESQRAVDATLAEYRECLSANPKKPQACESKRLAYEAELVRNQDIHRALQGVGSPPPTRQPAIWMQNMNGRTYNCNNMGGSVNCY